MQQKKTDITAKVKAAADKGLFLLPDNKNSVFGDPAPGVSKELLILFRINDIDYQMTISENQRADLNLEYFTTSTLVSSTLEIKNLGECTPALPTLQVVLKENNKKPFTINNISGNLNANSFKKIAMRQ